MKKALSLLLALVMVLSLVACGKAPAAETEKPAAEAAAPAAEAAAPAEEEIVNLVVLHRGNVGNAAEADVIAALNEYSAEKIGVTITWIAVDASEFAERLSRMIAAKDELDLTFVASYTGYADLVNKGGLMDITEMLQADEYAELRSVMPQAVWDASTINGRNYCVPNYKETPFVTTLVTPAALADTIKEKYGIDYNAIEIGSYREMDKLNDYLDACIAEGIEYPMLTNDLDAFIGQIIRSDTKYELVGTDAIMPYVLNKETHVVSNLFENPDFADWFEIMTSWNEKGYWSEDNIPLDWNARDQWPLDTWGIYPQNGIPDNAKQQSVSMGQEVYSINLGPATISSTGSLGSTWAIPAHTKKAEAALKWINLIQTDRYFADTYIYGVEGVNYTRVSEDVVEVIPDSGWSNGRWKTCNYENASITVADSPDLKEKYAEFNNAGVLNELATFTPDFTNIESERAAVKAVLSEVYHLYTLGYMTADDLPDTVASFKAAGDDVIIAELQKQVDAYFGK